MQIILTHEMADFDALASLLGAYLLDDSSLPILPRRLNRNVRASQTLYGMELPFVDPRDMPHEPIESVTLVDTQSLVSIRGMTSKTRVRVLDHHPVRENLPPECTVTYQDVGATSTLLVDYLREREDLRPATTADGRQTRTLRADAQFIFVAAQTVTGRLIRTQLPFNYAGRLPVYSSSDVFEPGGVGNNDLDGVIFPDMPWVIDAHGPAALLRDGMNATWPERAPGRSRLYAFSYDAYAIVAELGRRRSPFATPVAGLTGRLRLDALGRIHRELQFARVEDGQAQPLPAGPSPAP